MHNRVVKAATELSVPGEVASQHAAMVEVALLDGNRDKAHSVVERAFEIAEEVRCEELTLECDISKVHNGKAGGSLRAIGVDTVGKLLEMTRGELMRVGQINKKSADQIEAKLREFGYELSQFEIR